MVIGITGGVGCGKSTVMGILATEYHARILIADEMGHAAMEKGSTAYGAIIERFGRGILLSDGAVDRARLADIIYEDDTKREELNHIIHPFVYREIAKKIKEWEKEPLVVLETAILFETGCDKLCDEVWGILTDMEIRIQRLMSSRGYTRKKAESIMDKQMSETELSNRCDKLIRNNGSRQDLQIQLKELLCTEKKV